MYAGCRAFFVAFVYNSQDSAQPQPCRAHEACASRCTVAGGSMPPVGATAGEIAGTPVGWDALGANEIRHRFLPRAFYFAFASRASESHTLPINLVSALWAPPNPPWTARKAPRLCPLFTLLSLRSFLCSALRCARFSALLLTLFSALRFAPVCSAMLRF